MIRALLLSVILLSACATMAPREPAEAPPPSSADSADTCQMAAHQNLIGVEESTIDQSTLPAHHRVICFGCMRTMDYVADRLTIQIGPGHRVSGLSCG